jgi:hypothetical protein
VASWFFFGWVEMALRDTALNTSIAVSRLREMLAIAANVSHGSSPVNAPEIVYTVRG